MKKTMKLLTALLFSSVFIAPALADSPINLNPTTLSQLQWQDITLADKITTDLSSQQALSFTKTFAGIESPVAAYRIPATQGTIEIEISSIIEDKQVFIPSAIILDRDFNIATTYPSSEFKFYEERGMSPNRFTAELNLTPAANQGYIYLLIYTTKTDLAKTTMIPHPAKAYAKGTGKQPPALNDIEVQHSLNGQITVNVTNASGTRFIGMPVDVFSSNKKPTQPVGIIQSNTANSVNTPIDKDTEAYFNQAITKALKSKDVNKAMNLVNEAEKLGLTSPRKTFLKQVSAQ